MKSAYPNLNQPVKLTLFANVPFDNTYKDHSFISSKFVINVEGFNAKQPLSLYAKQENFLYRKNSSGVNVYPQWVMSGEYNFDYSNGLITSLTLELTSEQTNANYLAIQVGDDLGGETYYYFITSIRQSNFNTYTLSLELDVIMTFGDEFLDGMKNVPVMTKRKHCRRFYNFNNDDNNYVYSYEYKLGENVFEGAKTSLITSKIQSKLYHHDNTTQILLNNIDWIVVCREMAQTPYPFNQGFVCNGTIYPFLIEVLPVSKNRATYDIQHFYLSNGVREIEVGSNVMLSPSTLTSDGRFKSCKITPYPPFNSENYTLQYDTTQKRLTLISTSIEFNDDNHSLRIKMGNNYLRYWYDYGGSNDNTHDLTQFLVLEEQHDFEYYYDTLTYQLGFKQTKRTITDNRIDDPKLLFKPFTKYVITSSCGDEYEYYPELVYSLSPVQENGKIDLCTITTYYPGDFTSFTYIQERILDNDSGYSYYKDGKVGLSINQNYSIPVGENALEVFNATQSQSFNQSKIASGISNGLQIAGGAISAGIGLFSLIGSGGLSTPVSMGLVATGSGMMASGVAGVANTIKSTQAKMEDLRNTADTINISGSSYAHDSAMHLNNNLPYILIYEVMPIVKEQANDWFYSYGYEVGKDCYFNYVLPTSDEIEDDNIFTRTIFNYVQLSEDITMKINANIPYIVKQKLSNIFYQGITLWTFFGFNSLYTQQNRVPNESETYNIDKWLYKNKLENKEYKGEAYE